MVNHEITQSCEESGAQGYEAVTLGKNELSEWSWSAGELGRETQRQRSRWGAPQVGWGALWAHSLVLWASQSAHNTSPLPPTQLFMGCEPRARLLCPLERLSFRSGRKEGWHDAASSFLLPSPLPLILKEEGGAVSVTLRAQRKDSVFVPSSLEGQGRLQESGRALDEAEPSV